jgi:soluble lytic murein transglycosylase-like protein
MAAFLTTMSFGTTSCHLPWPSTPPIHGTQGSTSSGSCTQWEHLLEANGLPVDRFTRIMWKESGCDPNAVNRRSGATGLLQIMPQWITKWGGCSVEALKDPGWNIYHAKQIFDKQGFRAWSQTA